MYLAIYSGHNHFIEAKLYTFEASIQENHRIKLRELLTMQKTNIRHDFRMKIYTKG